MWLDKHLIIANLQWAEDDYARARRGVTAGQLPVRAGLMAWTALENARWLRDCLPMMCSIGLLP